MKKIAFIILTFITVSAFAQTQSNGPYHQLIIRGVTLINGDGAPPISPVDIVVEKNIIKAIKIVGYPGVPIDNTKRPVLKSCSKELDATGMYLLPGFIDMHGHIGGEGQGADWEYVFKLWMAHGITTVREPSGRGLEYTLDLKKRSAKNEIIAPRIIAHTGFGSGSDEPITTAEQAREWVRNNAKKGADGVKFFGSMSDIVGS
jgi:imidazolonepropionase-like amidohydrolase